VGIALSAAEFTWDPERYLTFAGPRLRPAMDLLARVPLARPARIYDLGCGTGHITRVLARRWPEAQVIGVDSSDTMIEQARPESDPESETATQAEAGRVTWQIADIARVADWSAPGSADLLYSNAALHWLPDHQTLLPRLVDQLAPGGVLAVQMPLSWHAPSHRLMRDVLAGGGPGGAPLGDAALRERLSRPPVMQPDEYYALLAPRADQVDIWKTDYLHVLGGDDPVLSWVTGTGLRPILQALMPTERARFLHQYRRRLAQAYPPGPDKKTLYLFPRLFVLVTRAAR
jgi:trans-aconitate 2-methyltransferase